MGLPLIRGKLEQWWTGLNLHHHWIAWFSRVKEDITEKFFGSMAWQLCHWAIYRRRRVYMVWSGSAAFLAPKQAMVMTTVFKAPDSHKKFVAETNTWDLGIGAMLMQDEHQIEFLSKTLIQAHKKLSIPERVLSSWWLLIIGTHILLPSVWCIQSFTSLSWRIPAKLQSNVCWFAQVTSVVFSWHWTRTYHP